MKVFRRTVAIFSCLSALLLAPAFAEAAVYQVYKDSFRDDANCPSNAECGINYDRVKAGKTLKITNVSCYLRHAESVGLAALQLVVQNNDSGNTRDYALTPNLQLQTKVAMSDGNQFVWAADDIVNVTVKAGQRIRIYAQVRKGSDGSLGSVLQLSCGIAGKIN